MRVWNGMAGACAALLGLVAVSLAGAAADGPRFFSIGTGSSAGTYFPVGSRIAAAISRPEGSSPCDQGGACGVDNLIATAVTSLGSFDNIEGIAEGRLDSGLAQADIVAWAYDGRAVYTGRGGYPQLRAIANLYPEHVHLVARRDLNVRSIGDLRGLRVAIDRDGSGTRINALLILHAFGVEHADIQAVSAGPDASITALLDGQADAAFFVVGFPSQAVTELMDTGDFELVPIDGVAAEQLIIANRFYTADTVPAEIYGLPDDVPTLTVGAQWITHAEAPEDLIYDITASLWRAENRALIGSGHLQAQRLSLETAVEGVTIPFHPGARRFYAEKGLLE
jgi:hypothetical protein